MKRPLEMAVAEAVRRQFAGAEIDSITVTPSEDSDGDPVLNITVVFASDMKALESGKFVSMVRHLRPHLMELNEHRFPMFSYLSKSDSDKLRNAAA